MTNTATAPFETPTASSIPFHKEKQFFKYTAGQFWSLTGSNLQVTTLAIMIVQKVGPVLGLAVCGDVTAYGYIPGMALALLSGIWLDTTNKKKVLYWTSWLGALQAIALAVLARDDAKHITILQIRLLAFTLGFINAPDSVNRNAIIRSLLYNRENALKAGAVFGSLYNFAMIFGGGLAAASYHYLGYSWTYLLNALSYIVLIATMTQVELPNAVKTPRIRLSELIRSIWRRAKDGIGHTFGDPGQRLSILMTGLLCMFGFSYNSILRVIVADMFGGGDDLYSRFVGWSGIGSLIGSILVIFYGKKHPKTLVVLGGSLMGGGLIAFSCTHDRFIGTCLMFVIGFGFMMSIMTTRSAIGHLAGEAYMSRAQGLAITVFFAGLAGGSSMLGHFAGHFGCPLALLCSGIITGLIALSMPFLPGANEITTWKK